MNIWIYSILMGYTIEFTFNFYVIRIYLQMKLYKKFKSDKLEIICRWMILRDIWCIFIFNVTNASFEGTFGFNGLAFVEYSILNNSVMSKERVHSSPKRSIITLTYIYLQRRIVVQCSHSFSLAIYFSICSRE